jgi:hypothetical protein
MQQLSPTGCDFELFFGIWSAVNAASTFLSMGKGGVAGTGEGAGGAPARPLGLQNNRPGQHTVGQKPHHRQVTGKEGVRLGRVSTKTAISSACKPSLSLSEGPSP